MAFGASDGPWSLSTLDRKFDMQREETVVVTLHDERPTGAGADQFKVFYAQLVQDSKMACAAPG